MWGQKPKAAEGGNVTRGTGTMGHVVDLGPGAQAWGETNPCDAQTLLDIRTTWETCPESFCQGLSPPVRTQSACESEWILEAVRGAHYSSGAHLVPGVALHHYFPMKPLQQPSEVDSTIPILQTRKLRLREVVVGAGSLLAVQ